MGDNNSCRLSDISSISYTNVTQDDNESLGCETNASLDNIIDSASSCRSDESPYELDHDEADYGLDSSGYFGNQDLFPERPIKVDKSSMTNLAPSDDDIKNFMSINDSHHNSGFSAEIKRDSTRPQKSMDESAGAEIREINISPKAEKPSNKNFGDTSTMDSCVRSPSFLHASSDDESSSELKDIFVNKDFSNKIELKLNGMIGTKSAISNCKGSKVMLEFYCSKNVDKERTDKLSEVRDELKVNKNTSRNTCSEFDMLENNLGYKDLIDLSRPQKESEVTVDMSLAKPIVITKSHDETKKVRIPSRIRPSPGLAKRIEESRAESTMQDSQPSAKFIPASTNDGFPTNNKRLLDLAKNDETNSQSADSSESKTEEKKSCSAKALDFCNEDIESSLNEIRSILYGSRIGLAKSTSHATNLNQSISSHAITKMQTSSNNLIDSSIHLTDKDLCTNNIKHSSSCEVLKDLSEEKIFTNEEEYAKTRDNPGDGQPVKAEMSVIDELLEELRMNEPNHVEDQDIPQINSPGVEMKSNLKYKLVDNHSERTYVVNLSVPYTLEKKTFSLSPEATDCDSIDASSIISEEGKSSPSAMPVVEDGLSSEDEGRDGLNEFPRGGKARKSYTNSIRAEHVPRVLKHEDRFFQTSSSGSVSNLSISSSHSKQNGFPVQMKLSEKQAPKKDIKPKVKDNSTEPLPVHLDKFVILYFGLCGTIDCLVCTYMYIIICLIFNNVNILIFEFALLLKTARKLHM